jgi:D-alanyl-D-alanine carboxypeptidase
VLNSLLLAACASPDFQAVLDESVADWDFPGATAVVVDGGEVSWSGASGVSDRLEGTPMGVDDRFRLGSLTKPFTVVVIHQLDQEGLLSFADPVSAWVSGVPGGDDITVGHLLGHTSGLGDYVDYASYWATAESPWALDDLLALAYQEIKGEPGERGFYSNAGFILLGLVIEAATGESWEEQVRVRITEPLGLDATGGYDELAVPVHGYEKEDGDVMDTSLHSHSENSWAAGALVSSAPDVAAFATALWGGALLDRAHLDLLLVPDPSTGSTDWFRSLGLRLDVVGGELNVGHMGKSVGYRSDWGTRGERDTTIVVMHNGSWRPARDVTDRLWDEHDLGLR